MSFFTGSSGKMRQQSIYGPEQQPLYQQRVKAGLQPGAGGAFGTAADYYRSLLQDENPTFSALQAPEQRRFNEQIIPDLTAQFANMGAGGLDSSSFRNAATSAGTDLAERLGAIRAQLRQQGAAGLQSIGEGGLTPAYENIYEQPQPGLLQNLAPAIGQVAGSFLGPLGSAAGGALGNLASGWLSQSSKGKSQPYGGTTTSLANKLPINPQVKFQGR